jgi:hypothetical protein
VLALGAPSVARALEAEGEVVQLIDRQPHQLVTNHWVGDVDVRLSLPIARVNVAIADPPWYPADFLDWAVVAGRCVGVGHIVYVSIWPDTARPTASDEHELMLDALEPWAHVTEYREILHYDVPRFESEAVRFGETSMLSRSPRVGSLLELRVLRNPPPVKHKVQHYDWARLVINDYQLALRLSEATTSSAADVGPHPEAKGWKWPYVSARAPGLDQIGLWSSRGEVALVKNPFQLLATLQKAMASSTTSAFEEALKEYPMLLGWEIPRPPYWRTFQWRHEQ